MYIGLNTAIVGQNNPSLTQIVSSLFSNGEQGAWYDPSDLSTLYQDAAGTIPVTAVEQPVGLMLDKSRGLMLGPELVSNGDFSNGLTGWTVIGNDATHTATPVTGGLRFLSDTTNPVLYVQQSNPLFANAYVEIIIDVDYTSGQLKFDCFGTSVPILPGRNKYRVYLSSGLVGLYRNTTNVNALIKSVSVKVIAGYHATQITTASRPTLQQESGKYYLSFDGVDDYMSPWAIDFTGTDKMTVVAGVRKLSDAATATLFETSSSIINNNGTLFFGSPTSTNSYQFNSKGSSESIAGSGNGVYVAPITNVVAGISDISGDSVILRVNGNQVAQSTADQGTGNYGNYPLYIGRRNGESLPFKGQLYGLIVRGALSSTAEITSAESYMNLHTGAY